ncbi:unnamed protein product [Calypogeia fissa]
MRGTTVHAKQAAKDCVGPSSFGIGLLPFVPEGNPQRIACLRSTQLPSTRPDGSPSTLARLAAGDSRVRVEGRSPGPVKAEKAFHASTRSFPRMNGVPYLWVLSI